MLFLKLYLNDPRFNKHLGRSHVHFIQIVSHLLDIFRIVNHNDGIRLIAVYRLSLA